MVPFWDYVTFMNCEKNKIYIYQELQEQPQGLLEEVEQCCKENVSFKKISFKCTFVQIIAKKKHKKTASQALYA